MGGGGEGEGEWEWGGEMKFTIYEKLFFSMGSTLPYFAGNSFKKVTVSCFLKFRSSWSFTLVTGTGETCTVD
jgi:hypothetical protein